MSEVKHHSCGVLVYKMIKDTPTFLLLKYPHGHIDFPKGHIEENESLTECALRELKEETGIDQVKLINGFFEQISYYYLENQTRHYKVVDFFLGETSASNVTVSNEHLDFIWADFDKSLELLTFDNAKDLLLKAKSFLDF